MKKSSLLAFVLLFLLSFMFVGCSFTTAKFVDLETSSAIDADYMPISPTSTFTPTTPIIYLTGSIESATIDSIIQIEWYYIEGGSEEFIADSLLTVDDINMYFYFSLSKPTNNWPVGDYEVRIYLDLDLMETVPFSVE